MHTTSTHRSILHSAALQKYKKLQPNIPPKANDDKSIHANFHSGIKFSHILSYLAVLPSVKLHNIPFLKKKNLKGAINILESASLPSNAIHKSIVHKASQSSAAAHKKKGGNPPSVSPNPIQ